MTSNLATIGHNRSPFELSEEEIEGLYLEAKNWLDGEGVKSQADADAISKLIEMLRKAATRADERRKEEAEPHRQEVLKVQAKYGPLIADNKSEKGKAVLAIEVCKKALTPWLRKLDEEKRAAAEAARKEADDKAAAAREAIRASREDDLEAREQAEALLKDAQRADTEANRAAKQKAHATGGSRAIGLRTTYRAELADPLAFGKYCWANHQDEYLAFLQELAQRLVNGKQRSIPGVTVHEDKGL